jgi:hypothetical protein
MRLARTFQVRESIALMPTQKNDKFSPSQLLLIYSATLVPKVLISAPRMIKRHAHHYICK